MTHELYAEVRAMRRRTAEIIATVEPFERAELWHAVDALDAWLNRNQASDGGAIEPAGRVA